MVANFLTLTAEEASSSSVIILGFVLLGLCPVVLATCSCFANADVLACFHLIASCCCLPVAIGNLDFGAKVSQRKAPLLLRLDHLSGA
jgi:hypothetical protein